MNTGRQPWAIGRYFGGFASAWAISGSMALGAAAPGASPENELSVTDSVPGCPDLNSSMLGEWRVVIDAPEPTTLALPLPMLAKGSEILIAATESGADVRLEAGLDAADSPIRRSGTQFLIVRGGDAQLAVRLIAKEHHTTRGTVLVRAYDATAGKIDARCRGLMDDLVSADRAYAAGQLEVRGGSTAAMPSAVSTPLPAAANFAMAWRAYVAAFGESAKVGNALMRARLAHSIAALQYQDRHDWEDSARWASQAAELYLAAHDLYGRARARALEAAARMEVATLPDAGSAGDAVRRDSSLMLARARETLEGIARFHARRREYYDEALQRNNIGLAFYYDGRYDDAVRTYRRALRRYVELGERYRDAQVSQNIALIDWEMGRYAAALAGYQHALRVLDRDESPQLYADILNNAAMANFATGHLDRALEQHTDALDIMTRIEQPREQARSMFGIASVYAAVGDRELAKSFLAQSLQIRSAALDARGRVGSLRALALLRAEDGDLRESLRLNEEALRIAIDPPVRVVVLTQIAEIESRLGYAGAAREAIMLADEVAGRADAITRAKVELEQSAVARRAGDQETARLAAAHALATFERFGLAMYSFDAQLALAEVDIAAGRRGGALHFLDRAIDLAEDIRAEAASPEFRAGLMQPLRPAFDLEIEVYAARYEEARGRGDAAAARAAGLAALEVSERARARAMADVSSARYGPKVEAEVARLSERRTAALRLLAAAKYQLAMRREESKASVVAALRRQIAVLDSRIAILGRGERDVRFKGQPWSEKIQALPANVAVISYWMTPSRAYAWVLTRAAVTYLDLGAAAPIRAATAAVQATQRAIRDGTVDAALTAGAALGAQILRQPLGALPAGISRVIFVADGPLHFVSFAGLPNPGDGDHFLIEKFDVAYAAGISMLIDGARDGMQATGRMLLVDDAVYGNDVRLADTGMNGTSAARAEDVADTEKYARLPGTADEAGIITAQMPPGSIDRLEGFDASRARVLAMDLPAYQYIHFAVHGMSDADIPQFSSLILSQYDRGGHRIEDHLWTGDFATRRLTAQTVVFSACDSALGHRVDGEGLMGLRYVALARGAHAVVASLWDIPDRVTMDLMGSFYRELIEAHLTADAALASAMRRVIARGPGDPALWAAFTVTLSSL